VFGSIPDSGLNTNLTTYHFVSEENVEMPQGLQNKPEKKKQRPA
jgi:hypothetical protein